MLLRIGLSMPMRRLLRSRRMPIWLLLVLHRLTICLTALLLRRLAVRGLALLPLGGMVGRVLALLRRCLTI